MIRTSKKNKEIIRRLTRKFGLGYENHISRIAFAYSIKSERKLDISEIKDSNGKTYSKPVFFGDNLNTYIGLICCKYEIHSSDKDVIKYIKMHVDDGLESINDLVSDRGINDKLDFFNILI